MSRRNTATPAPSTKARFTDWDANTLVPAPPSPPPPRADAIHEAGAVEYLDDGRVVAWLNAQFQPTTQDRATYAKVWQTDGAIQILRRTGA